MKTKAYPWHELGVVDGPVDQKTNGKIEFPAYLRPTDESANAPMPRCRTPIPSKGKQRIWVVSYRKRSIETQIAGISPPPQHLVFRWMSLSDRGWCPLTAFTFHRVPTSNLIVLLTVLGCPLMCSVGIRSVTEKVGIKRRVRAALFLSLSNTEGVGSDDRQRCRSAGTHAVIRNSPSWQLSLAG